MYANGPKIVTDGLVLCLDAGNRKSYVGSGTSWVDISRNGNNGTLINGPTFNSDNIGSIVFDGANDYVAIPSSSLVSGSQMTFDVWNFGISAQDSSVVYFTNGAGHRLLNIHLPFEGNLIFFDAGNGSGNIGPWDRIFKTATNAEYQGWHYWAFTKNSVAGTMRIYRNGQLWHSETSLTAPIGAASVDGNLGGAVDLGGYHIGRIGSAKLYSRELSASEVLQNYNATKGRFKL